MVALSSMELDQLLFVKPTNFYPFFSHTPFGPEIAAPSGWLRLLINFSNLDWKCQIKSPSSLRSRRLKNSPETQLNLLLEQIHSRSLRYNKLCPFKFELSSTINFFLKYASCFLCLGDLKKFKDRNTHNMHFILSSIFLTLCICLNIHLSSFCWSNVL